MHRSLGSVLATPWQRPVNNHRYNYTNPLLLKLNRHTHFWRFDCQTSPELSALFSLIAVGTDFVQIIQLHEPTAQPFQTHPEKKQPSAMKAAVFAVLYLLFEGGPCHWTRLAVPCLRVGHIALHFHPQWSFSDADWLDLSDNTGIKYRCSFRIPYNKWHHPGWFIWNPGILGGG